MRSVAVSIYFAVAPMLRSDLSESMIYVNGLPNHAFELPRGGCIWDVGANDGIFHSNSYYPIRSQDFTAFLFEPDPEPFLKLRDRYGRVGGPYSSKVELFNFGISGKPGVETLRGFPMSFENTVLEHDEKTDSFDKQKFTYGVSLESAQLLCQQRNDALKAGACRSSLPTAGSSGSGSTTTDFTILSIDIEGLDRSVLLSAHSGRLCTWDLLIIETPGDYKVFDELGYVLLFKAGLNYVFALKSSPYFRGGSMQ